MKDPDRMNEQEILYCMALQRILPLNAGVQNLLMNELGSATAVYEHRRDLRSLLPDATERLVEALSQMEDQLPRAEQELEFAQKGQIRCITRDDADFPQRLLNCPDAPILLYYRGNANLNSRHIINMVGTRHCTEYGKRLCEDFLKDLSQLVPDTLVLSGLAYGIDIHAHRAAMNNGLATVGIVAHGLDQIYPRAHRNDAIRMLNNGGLLTEFMSGGIADKINFVSRNRIVAGMADACIVVESMAKGGSLITAEIAEDYGRDVFAFPGRTHDEKSAGCNNLIRDNRAGILLSAEDFVLSMRWVTEKQKREPVQRELFPELTAEEQKVFDALKGTDGKEINQLTVETGMPISKLSNLLFDLELRGIIKMLNGGRYIAL